MSTPDDSYRSPGYSSQYAVARGTRRVRETGGMYLVMFVGLLMLGLAFFLT